MTEDLFPEVFRIHSRTLSAKTITKKLSITRFFTVEMSIWLLGQSEFVRDKTEKEFQKSALNQSLPCQPRNWC